MSHPRFRESGLLSPRHRRSVDWGLKGLPRWFGPDPCILALEFWKGVGCCATAVQIRSRGYINSFILSLSLSLSLPPSLSPSLGDSMPGAVAAHLLFSITSLGTVKWIIDKGSWNDVGRGEGAVGGGNEEKCLMTS
jgi:hypothetical protein